MNKNILLAICIATLPTISSAIEEYQSNLQPEKVSPIMVDYSDSANQFLELKECFSFEKLSEALKTLSTDFYDTLNALNNSEDLDSAKEVAGASLAQMRVIADVISKLKQ